MAAATRAQATANDENLIFIDMATSQLSKRAKRVSDAMGETALFDNPYFNAFNIAETALFPLTQTIILE